MKFDEGLFYTTLFLSIVKKINYLFSFLFFLTQLLNSLGGRGRSCNVFIVKPDDHYAF